MNNLVLIEKKQMQEAFKPLGLDVFIAKIKQEVSKFTADVTTRKGRAEIKTISYEISRSKTYLDGVGKEYVAHLKKLPVEADRERKRMRDTLDILKDETRAPLTEWEEDEAVKKAAVQLALEIKHAHDLAIQEDFLFNEQRRIAEREVKIAEKEAELKAKHEAEERASKEKKEAERKVWEAEEAAKREQLEANQKIWEAEERAKRIERERQEDADRAEREKQEAVKLAKETAQHEADKVESKRLETENRQREEEEKRISDKNHREGIFKQSVDSLMETFVCDDITQATQIVQAVADNLVKNISINY